ncbi:MAG: tetratricopeptide repeat protein [Verrucomicrobia bacterium]|nr:tetratricopeptide repeat protein [Verrucomicrobiota bacterium]
MRIRIIFAGLLALGAAGGLRAQEAIAPTAPLITVPGLTPSPGANAVSLEAAQRAQELGFPSAAAALYREMLVQAGADHTTLTLALATALLDEGLAAEANDSLNTILIGRGAAWQLRSGLAAALSGRLDAAKAALAAIKPADLAPEDKSWYQYLQGLTAEAAGDMDKAKVFFAQAEALATSAQARARFLLKREQALLRSGPVSEADAERTRKNLDQLQGRQVSYGLARTYAAMLDTLGKRNEAVSVLRRLLLTLPPEERAEIDRTRLFLGLIAGAGEGPGRSALEELLDNGNDRDLQRVALQLLARASLRDPARAAFRRQLDRLIALPAPHAVLEDLLLYRAQLALGDKNYDQAEGDARALLQTFPGSPLKPQAYGVLTGSAWEQRRYRTAADNAAKARAELPAGPEHAQLGVLVAEAWFRARDYRSAADAYAAVLREPPAGVPTGDLMFQRVVAEIDGGTPATAATVLDELARDPRFDVVNRWKAEWNLARALQVDGRTAEAFERVSRLLAGGADAALPAELRARMAWLQAQLAAKAGHPDQTLKLVDALAASLDGVPTQLKTEIASSGALLRAEANFSLKRDADALANVAQLRKDFPRSDAAMYSYFDEAEHYARQDKAVEAQQLLTKLADDFPDNAYAPFALFQAALQAERRGQDTNLKEANKLIEGLITKYPTSELVFSARLKQGDLLRKLNQFPQAQRVYEELVNKYSQRPDVVLAQLALAECHNAQSASEPLHLENAQVLFEHVRDRVDAPLEARVEAGFNLGYLLARRGATAKAETVWWRDVVGEFLLKDDVAARLGDRGRYWMARTLLELGTLYEQQEKLEQAKEAWLLILRTKLPGEALAKARLARFNLPEAKP